MVNDNPPEDNNITSLLIHLEGDEGTVLLSVDGARWPVRYTRHQGQDWLSVVDIVAAITGHDHNGARKYWNDLKRRLAGQEGAQLEGDGNQSVFFLHQLRLVSPGDGKRYLTDCATLEGTLRVIQSIPSPRAEPVKRWLARLGRERIEEQADPDLALDRTLDRARTRWDRMGRPAAWQHARLEGMFSRKAFTSALAAAVGGELGDNRLFGQVTNDIYRCTFHRDAGELKAAMGLSRRQNIRDNLPQAALHLLGFIETVCAEQLDTTDDILTPEQARAIVQEIAALAGLTVEQIESRLGYDIATGRPLLKGE